MSGADLLALAERIEVATEPDRELDALIAAALRIGTEHAWANNFPEWQGRSDGRVYLEDGGPSFKAPAFTASLDAAMTLVPEGLFPTMDFETVRCWLRKAGGFDVVNGPAYGFAAAMPRALCAAALRTKGGEA